MVDATTQEALEATVLNLRCLIYADFAGDVLRATSGLYDKTISGTGDAELDGYYDSFENNVISVGSVRHNETGSDTLTITMGGLLVSLDYLTERDNDFVYDRFGAPVQSRVSDFLNLIGDRSRWQGRTARLWFYVVDENESQIGSIIPYYTGYMSDVTISGSPDSQSVTLTVENYVATLSGAPNKTYLMQNVFDAGDLSANVSIGAANGLGAGGSVPAGVGSGGMIWADRMNVKNV
jgi:hypothetical protein